MPNPDTQNSPRIRRTEQYIQNASFDETYQILAVELLGENTAGTALVRVKTNGDGSLSSDKPTYKKLIDDSTTASVTYIGEAAAGSATSSAAWRIKKIDESSSPVSITYAGRDFTSVWNNRATTEVYS